MKAWGRGSKGRHQRRARAGVREDIEEKKAEEEKEEQQ